jgi:hypothetical protein
MLGTEGVLELMDLGHDHVGAVRAACATRVLEAGWVLLQVWPPVAAVAFPRPGGSREVPDSSRRFTAYA